MPPTLRRATLLAHAGSHVPAPDAQPHAPPIYQTAGFEYEDAASAYSNAVVWKIGGACGRTDGIGAWIPACAVRVARFMAGL